MINGISDKHTVMASPRSAVLIQEKKPKIPNFVDTVKISDKLPAPGWTSILSRGTDLLIALLESPAPKREKGKEGGEEAAIRGDEGGNIEAFYADSSTSVDFEELINDTYQHLKKCIENVRKNFEADDEDKNARDKQIEKKSDEKKLEEKLFNKEIDKIENDLKIEIGKLDSGDISRDKSASKLASIIVSMKKLAGKVLNSKLSSNLKLKVLLRIVRILELIRDLKN